MSEQIDYEKMYSDEKLEHGAPAATPWDVGVPQPFVTQLAALGVIRGEVLDVGTGPGHNSIYLASQGHSVTGIDGAASAIERAKINARAAGETPTFHVGDGTTLDGFTDAFDTVIDSAFFHMLADDEEAQKRYLSSLHRATRPKARLYMLEMGCHNVNGIVNPRSIPEETFRRLLPEHGWQITYLGTNTYLGSIAVAAMAETNPQVAESLNSEMFAPLKAIAPFLTDGRVHFPFWEVHATRVD
ncbi:class I SAM-dependent methyltransferase [Mycobacteroides abscessus]